MIFLVVSKEVHFLKALLIVTVMKSLMRSVSRKKGGSNWKQLITLNPVFDWFVQHKAPVMRVTMIKSICEEACLGIPPEQFTTNASETIKSVIKARFL